MASAPNRSTSQITPLKVVWKTSVIENVLLSGLPLTDISREAESVSYGGEKSHGTRNS